jgi:peptide/nickel transport system permease protein
MPHRIRFGFYLAVAFIAVLVVIVAFGPWIVPYDPIAQDLRHPFLPPSWQHWLGTDNLGRDVLSRLMIGARPALTGVLIAVGTAALVGIPWGLSAGYVGGLIDLVLMRIADALLVFPGLILALVLTAIFGPSLRMSMIAIGLVYSPILARVVRSGVLAVRNRDYVLVTQMYGLSDVYRMWRHVLPNASAPIIVQVTLLMGLSLLAQIGLGFLGVGLQPPNPSWGSALAESFPYIIVSPQASFAPGIVVALTVLALYRVGDELRDRFAQHQ